MLPGLSFKDVKQSEAHFVKLYQQVRRKDFGNAAISRLADSSDNKGTKVTSSNKQNVKKFKHKLSKIPNENVDAKTDARHTTYKKHTDSHDHHNPSRKELRDKLQEKISLLKGVRKTDTVIQDRKRMKRKLKKIRRQIIKKEVQAASETRDKAKSIVKPNDDTSTPITTKSNQDNLSFSRFNFTDANSQKNLWADKKRKKNVGGKDFKRLLEHAKKRKSSDVENSNLSEQNQQWQSAILKASGAKLKDDVKLLEKAEKRKDKQKKKNKSLWMEREAKVEQKKDARQQKRKQNINTKKQEKKKKKMKKLIKTGRIIPGF